MFKEHCEGKGIQQQLTIPCTSQQNGIVERKNRTLLGMVSLMMAHAYLLISFWRGQLLTVAYILNCMPNQSVHNPNHKYGKFDLRATKMAFVRYSAHFKGYVMYKEHPNSGMIDIDSHNFDFLDNEFLSIGAIKE